MEDATLMGLLIGASIFLFCGILVFMFWQSNQTWKDIEKNEPLITEAGTRAEEALYVATQGSVKCSTCAFDNYKHLSFCAVCGDALGDESTRKKTLKKRAKQAGPVVVGSRKDRALRRTEWVRKTDVEGKLFWYRAPVDQGSIQPQAAYFVHFDGASGASAAGVDGLTNEVSQLQVKWVDPVGGDALAFSTGSSVLTGPASSILSVSQQEFPAKYADFVQRTAAFASPEGKLRLRFKDANKEVVYQQSMVQLAVLSQKDLRAPFLVAFSHGGAFAASTKSVDWHRDWFSMVNEKLADPASGLFKCVNDVDQTYYINPDSKAIAGDDHLNYFYAAGRLIGRALLQGDLMAFHMATPLLKILLGQPLSFHDLEHFDPVTYKNLKVLLENDNVQSLDLDFSVHEKKPNGEVVTIDLIPNGREVQVTDANKMEYLNRKTQHVLVESVSTQLYALCKGFYEVVPQELLLIFDPEELDYVLCGSDEIDADEWERESKYQQGLYDHPAKKWFWRFVREMPEDYKRRLLHFATGSTRLPMGGFAALKSFDGRLAPFTLQCVELVNSRLVKSDPCLNQFTLPMYVEKKKLKAMLYAVLDPELYEFVIAK